VLAALLLGALWSFGIEPRWVALRWVPHQVEGWRGPPGMKVAVAADWHLTNRAWWRVMTVQRATEIVDEINAARPDLILLPGDFIADRDYRPVNAATAEDEIAEVLGKLKAPLGVYAVLGNHDWWHGGGRFAAALRRQGIRVLENEAAPLSGTALWIAAVGDHSTGHSHALAALTFLPQGAQALVFMHDPASLFELPRVRGLVVAAHTHGGQVYLPGVGALVVPGAAPRAWAHGWVRHNGNRAYVTSGLGVSILPVRFNMRPEWVMFTIHDGPENKEGL
jgi:uncharacterized protein